MSDSGIAEKQPTGAVSPGHAAHKPMGFWRALLLMAALCLVLVGVLTGLLFAYGASFLRVNHLKHADVILILGGGLDDSRYWHAVDLMKAGYADKIVMDAEDFFSKYDKTNTELAEEFLLRNHDEHTTVCPLANDSTYGETVDVARCLAPMNVSSVLIVTSDYHTRRAFSIFKARLPHYHWAITGTFNAIPPAKEETPTADKWWRTRGWAKTILDEWEKLIWWEMVDRWRPHLVVQS